MNIRKTVKDIAVLVLILFLIFFPSLCLFFSDGGQIFGINYNPDTKPNPVGQNIDAVLVTPGNPNIEPIYDGAEIIQVELWQLPLRDIIISLVTQHMAYIPPSFSQLLSVFYLALGLCLFVLYRQKTKSKEREPNSRREIIFQTILQNPGTNQQEIINKTGFSRGSVRYHLQALLQNQEIVTAEFEGHAHYIGKKADLTLHEQLLLISLAEKKSAAVFLCLAKTECAEISELAECAEVSISTMRWRINRLEERGLIQRREMSGTITYLLTDKTRNRLAELLPELHFHQ